MNQQTKVQIRLKNNFTNKRGDQSRTSAHKSFQTADKKESQFGYSQIHIPSNSYFHHGSMLEQSNQSQNYTNRSSQKRNKIGEHILSATKREECHHSQRLSKQQHKIIHTEKNSENQCNLSTMQQSAVQLTERLKNLHCFYQLRINEEKQRNLERDQTILAVLQDLQNSHNHKINQYQKILKQVQDEKKELNNVDDRMGNIKEVIQDILQQSKQIKIANEDLQKQISHKQKNIKQKKRESLRLKEKLKQIRQELQDLQKYNLKENMRSRELIQLIDTQTKN